MSAPAPKLRYIIVNSEGRKTALFMTLRAVKRHTIIGKSVAPTLES